MTFRLAVNMDIEFENGDLAQQLLRDILANRILGEAQIVHQFAAEVSSEEED